MTSAEPGDPGPLGHSNAAHRVFGWCAQCRGRTTEQEVAAWRGFGFQVLDLVVEGICAGA